MSLLSLTNRSDEPIILSNHVMAYDIKPNIVVGVVMFE